jgi:plasmid maintenance system killer protein
MIESFADKVTAAIFTGHAVRGLPMQMQRPARAKLLAIDAASRLDDLRAPVNTVFASTIDGASVLYGAIGMRGMSRSSTTIEEVE